MARARLLDLTRSLRRAGRVGTGIDRVELAYLEQFCALLEPVYGLVRTPFGYLLIDRSGMEAFGERLRGERPWGAASLISRFAARRAGTVQQAESDLRRVAIARGRPRQLRRILTQQFPDGFDYFNVGHSNLSKHCLAAVKASGGLVHVLVHDVIPIEHPEFQRPGTVKRFRQKMALVAAAADRVICNSEDTKRRANAFFAQQGRVPESIVSYLGTIVSMPDPTQLPKGLPPAPPYFVVVGTIEPRKNHGLLLDVWDALGPAAPGLLICGSRGWNNEDVFARLDALPPDSPVKEVAGLSDAALAAVVQRSAGTLFPSLAEGFGLPPVEALALGSRVLCNDLAVFREILGENAVYASSSDRNLWINTVKNWAEKPPQAHKDPAFQAPSWEDHFNTVLRLT